MIHFRDITRIKKKIGSFYLPNAIEIRTSKKKYLFASFIHRSKAFGILVNQWSIHGGLDKSTATDRASDDDSDDEVDDEVESINSGLDSSSLSASLTNSIRSLSPLTKSSATSASGNGNGESASSANGNGNGNGNGKKSKNNTPLMDGSKNKPSTPTSMAQTNPFAMKLIIDIEDYQQLGCNNLLMITVSKENTIQELLEKLKTKLSMNEDFFKTYQLAVIKKKKSQLKRSSGIFFSTIDQILAHPGLLEAIDNNAVQLMHRSAGSTSSVEQRFIILESHRQLMSYQLDTDNGSTTIYLKKPKQVDQLHLCFEIIEDGSKMVKLTQQQSIVIGDIFKELSKSSSRKLFASDYSFYLPKNGERGVILNPTKLLSHYHLRSNNATIQVNKYPPFDNFAQKFRYTTSRNKKTLLFELVQSCLTHSIPSMQMQAMYHRQQFLNRLQQKLSIDDTEAKGITKNVLTINSYKDEGLLIELKNRCEQLQAPLETNPYYNTEAFGGLPALYDQWRRRELTHITHLMRSIIFKEDCFYGVVFLTIIEADGLDDDQLMAGNHHYCIVSTPSQRIRTNTHASNDEQPSWNSQFMLKIKQPKCKLELALMSSGAPTDSSTPVECSDTLLGKLEINTKDFEDSEPKDMWYSLPSKGRLHLLVEYQYQFTETNQYLTRLMDKVDNTSESLVDNNIDPSKQAPVDHVNLFKILLNFIVEDSQNPNNLDDNDVDDPDSMEWIYPPHRSLLNQYCIRFGVGRLTALIIQLEQMLEMYSIEKRFIVELEDVTSSLIDIVGGVDEEPIFTVAENTLLKNTLDKFIPKIKYNVGRYYESFPNNKPRDSLKTLVRSLENIIHLQALLDKKPKPASTMFNQLLSQIIRDESKKKFDENIESLGFTTLEQSQKIKEAETITKMLVEVMAIIQEEVNNTIQFESAFPMEIKITCDVIDAWGPCIMRVIEDFCNWAPYNANILSLVRRLLDYYNFTKKISGDMFKPLPLKQLFITYVYRLLKEIKVQLHNTQKSALSSDDKFFQACDNTIKDFGSLSWLPDPFSFVQLLEVLTIEIIEYCRSVSSSFEHFIEHTELEQPGKPNLFTLNPEPCVMLNNIDSSRSRLETYGSKLGKELARHLQSEQGAQLDDVSKQCVTDSFKICLDESLRTINELYTSTLTLLTTRMKNYVFFLFQDVLFNPPLSLLNSHMKDTDIDPDSQVVSTTNPSDGGLYEAVNTSPQPISSVGGGGGSSGNLNSSTKSTANNNSNKQYEKQILTSIKDFLSPKIEELYSTIKEPLFKQFIRKLWGELVDDMIYLVIPRPSDQRASFHVPNNILANEQISIINNCLKDLMSLFHRGGAGCPTPTLEERVTPLRQLLTASEMDTTALIDLHNQRRLGSSSKSGQLNAISKEQIIGVLSTRMEFDKEARSFVNKVNGVVELSESNQVLPEIINVVPESEFVIDRYHCSLNGQLGILVLSSRYVGFHNLLKEIGVKLGQRVSVPLVSISEIKKTKVAILFNAMQVNTKDGKSYTFTGFFDRDSVFRDVSYQMKVAQKNQK
ncbi:hypothetical protein SAMD00019534_045840 [Acytostelium subglobosum LB1]|uniref:hypothetical protein n=1 Tax=Acytostelium subglobosum LB1 TaxID=1410327 RepID=UPI000644C809|nr:hypothetical protein SAMD00019534_045840 [Acytostelium subglobosum LB1]GAM21409.1 hypothetical protein SAMD00019534_045840 [Acytostelium subglobosum LB1]|eukprot:XP_012755528.1 hypothetical protein SAMD00019534_045840 [Acytostelium subglobosum LB1]